jgi:thiosulfate reductase cytochrome b subunit
MENDDHMLDGNCYRHKHVKDSDPQLSTSTLRFNLFAYDRGTKAFSVHKKIIRTFLLLSGTCRIAAYGNAPAPGFTMAGGIFHGSLSFIWAHYNVASILEPRKLLFGCASCIVRQLWVRCIPWGVHCTKLVRVHVSAQEGIDLDLAVLRIHTIDTFRTEKYLCILTLNIYLKRNTSVYKDI